MGDSNILLRQLKLSDVSQLTILANNKKVWDNVRDYFPYPYTEKDAEVFINLTKEQNPRQSFGIEFNGELCGVISLIPQKDVYKKSAEIGYWIGEPYWGKGIMTKAVGLITRYGFDELNVIRIFAGIFEYNVASMKILENNGYKKEAISEKAVFKNGKIWDEHRYYILNKDYSMK
ncbi:GNAT family N-acetyltransferase [Aquimarina mytili]|uniref:GNAT family N-acetyltransferase n=1 Tax=Aquimarina mytili TaxID=874423 RepID=A0A936ZQK2_9FLAO|nr:GNAT family protein [Aquimarina mytili]MBL0682462.1 GNAT family N-acetyltransferase [Aquimarina mytili]